MRLSAKIILNFANSNQFDFGDSWKIRAGDPNTLYFQVVDLDQNGLRYLPGIGGGNTPVVVTVTFPSIDDSKVLQIPAVADSNDPSIFKVVIAPSQQPNSGIVKFKIAEGSNIRNFNVLGAISVEYPNQPGWDGTAPQNFNGFTKAD